MRDHVALDRKFHTGMVRIAELLDVNLRCLVPEGQPQSLDMVDHAPSDLPYEVAYLDRPGDIEQTLAESDVLYGMNLDIVAAARKRGVPYVMVTEHSWSIRQALAHFSVATGRLKRARRAYRRSRAVVEHLQEMRAMQGARSVHCNGYPAYETAGIARHKVLYFDSRMSDRDMIAEEAIHARFADYGQRPARLVFTGRLETFKGPYDVLTTAKHLRRYFPNFKLDFYGDGSERQRLIEEITRCGMTDVVEVHRPVPFVELLKRVKQADLFISCHVQGDPSCTYLETFGAGVPIAGYANDMWRPLARESEGGVATEMSNPDRLARTVSSILREPAQLRGMACNALRFAKAHSFENEFQRRMNDLKQHLPAA